MIPTVNFHLIKACNYKCKFCYATFNDIHVKSMTRSEQLELIELLAKSKLFRKINFAGGEPTLVPHITDLIKHAKSLGFETSIVTNVSRIDFNWVKEISPYLDILTMSIDSINDDTNIRIGRNQSGKTNKIDKLEEIAKACHTFGVNLKINTVVSAFNVSEDLSFFINQLNPFRWKIFQVTKVEGQNDKYFESLKIDNEEFNYFCERNQKHISPNTKVVVESEEIIRGSYLMIDQLGRFFDDSNQIHNYSDKILKIGVHNALQQIEIDVNKFEIREGNYTTIKNDKLCTF